MTYLPSDFETRMRRQGERYRSAQGVNISTDEYLFNSQIARKNVYNVIAGALRILRKQYGVECLSIIEGVRLRWIVEECVAQYREEINMFLSKEWTKDKYSDNHISPAQESAARWIQDLYGIDMLRICFTEDVQIYLARKREEAHHI